MSSEETAARRPRSGTGVGPERATATLEIDVHYPLEPGSSLVLRTDRDWDENLPPVELFEGGTGARFAVPTTAAHFYFKPVLRIGGEERWSQGPNYLAVPAASDRWPVYPHFSPDATCSACLLREIETEAGEVHRYRVFYPPGYQENPLSAIPRALHAGRPQSLLRCGGVPGAALGGGGRRSPALTAMNVLDGALVVGLYPNDRQREYTAPGYESYARFIAEQIKPAVDAHYRTLPGPEHTAAVGSSLGGVLSLYLAWEHSEVFGHGRMPVEQLRLARRSAPADSRRAQEADSHLPRQRLAGRQLRDDARHARPARRPRIPRGRGPPLLRLPACLSQREVLGAARPHPVPAVLRISAAGAPSCGAACDPARPGDSRRFRAPFEPRVDRDQRARRLGKLHGLRRPQPRATTVSSWRRCGRQWRRIVLLSPGSTRHCASATRGTSSDAAGFPGAVHPRGFEHLTGFARDLVPVFEYEAGGIRLRKTIAAISGENTTVVLYEVLAAPARFRMELRPFLAARDCHALASANDGIGAELEMAGGILRTRPYPDGPELFLAVPGAEFRRQPEWYYHFEYEEERRRGFDFREDLWTPGVLEIPLGPGDRVGVIASTASPAGRDAVTLVEGERARRRRLLDTLPGASPLLRTLALAADQFVVRRGNDLRTILAGYPWFSDWGRDAMIALPGICLTTGRYEVARGVLLAFAQSADRGMLPNRFPDDGAEAEYNTVDAALWFFVAAWKYLERTGDRDFVREALLPVLRDIVTCYERGTRFGIHVTPDGLLTAGEPGVQLTWMDAKVGDWVVTPRQGKAVEVNALWYNALAILAAIERRCGAPSAEAPLRRRAERSKRAFARLFWNEEAGCLYDVVGEDGRVDASIRPNQLLALSLPFRLLPPARACSVLAVVEAKLLTPVGLRSLAPEDPRYRPRYVGGPAERDAAYHQGTVWSWLLGPFVTALVRYRGVAGRRQARDLLEGLRPHLSEAGVGSISEIFDGDAPHAPRGCIAQAWSVAEALRALVEEVTDARTPSRRR